MTAGKDMLLKLDQTGSGSFLTVAGLRSRALSFNAAAIDITDAESAEHWRELLSKGELRRAAVSGTGIAKDNASDAKLRELFFAGTIREKIGFSKNAQSRLHTLQTGSPNRLRIIRSFLAHSECERRLHEALSDFHIHLEWFTYSELIRDLVDELIYCVRGSHDEDAFTVRDIDEAVAYVREELASAE